MSSMLPNDVRYSGRPGHVESWFLRANDPSRPRAFWLKATILSPLAGGRGVSRTSDRPGSAVAEVWCIVFDGEKNRVWAHRETVPFPAAVFDRGEPARISLAGCRFELGPDGNLAGALTRPGEGLVEWKLSYRNSAEPQGEPLNVLPFEALIDGPFPRSKLLTPSPSATFSGNLNCFGELWDIEDWPGMQGHNWGKEHAWEYAWGQCLFPATSDQPAAMVEGFTARIRLAGRVTPRMSVIVARVGGLEYRFDNLFDFWRQEASIDDLRWSVKLRAADGEAELTMDAGGRPMACLGYGNPDGRQSYCFNSKLARVTLDIRPALGRPITLVSEHGGALEFLRGEPDPRFPNIV